MFRNYKSKLNSKLAKKGLDPTKRYRISTSQWAVFLEQRSTEEFKAVSEAKSELAKRKQVPPLPRHMWLPAQAAPMGVRG